MTRRRNPQNGRAPFASDLTTAAAALRALDGSADEVEQLARRLAPQLAAPTAPVGRPPIAASALKVVSGLVVGTVLVGGLVFLGSQREESKETPLRGLPAVRVEATRPALPPSSTPAPEAMPASASTGGRAAPRAVVASRRRPRAKATSEAVPRPRHSSGSVEAELKLLARAQSALGTSPRAALDLCKQHARHYVHGIFAQEREVIAIEAEMKMGRGETAARRARRFLQTYPRSTHSGRVRALVADEEIAPPANNAASAPTPN